MVDAHGPHYRLFAAVPLPDELKTRMKGIMEGLRERLSFQKWVHPHDLHLTLAFLGDTPAAAVDAVMSRLQEAAGRSSPFTLRLEQTGVFGPSRSPRILWAGVHGELDKLTRLHGDVELQLQSIGYTPEERAYSPHLTLARQYTGSGPLTREALSASFPDDGQPYHWTADSMLLYRSHPGRTPMYEALGTFPLGG